MARDYYETTIALPDPTAGNAIKPLSAVKVSVVPRGATDITNTLVDIFPADTGLTKGPDPKSGASGTNPFTTNASGSVRFWAEGPAELDIVFEDTQAPARITDRVGWNAVPAKAGTIPTSMLVPDGGIKQSHLAAEVVYQQVPIGGVIDWWRPVGTVNPPGGFETCDGHPVTQHEFPGVSGTISLPDLRNVFILGADVSKTDGSGAANNDAPTGAPGIRGVGGSNNHTLTLAQSPSHAHNGATASMNRNQDHSHGGATGAVLMASGGEALIGWLGGPLTYGVKNSGQVIATDGRNVDHEHAFNTSYAGSDQSHNNMPRWIGLLKIMKVRRA